jgi:arylsulfatase A-like enzyme
MRVAHRDCCGPGSRGGHDSSHRGVRILVLAALCCQILAAPAAAATVREGLRPKPNVLIIVADDLGYADIGVHGGRDAQTPHIDALAASGVRCTSGYVSAPYCSPSRAGLLTGRYQTRFGHEFNPHEGDEANLGLPLDQRTIADYFRSAGYATSLIGKWHEGFDAGHHPQARGFDDFFGFLVGAHNFVLHKGAEPKFGSAYSQNMIYRGHELQDLEGYTTDLFTDEAINFIQRHNHDPWFLVLSYNAVHTPLENARKYGDRVPAAVEDRDRRAYLSLLIGLDDGVGRVMAALRRSGLDKDTLVFFLSDNGGPGRNPYLAFNASLNTPLRGDKGQTLEGGIRVPFFASWSGQLPAGKTFSHPVMGLDILPTACAAAGIELGSDIDGVNLLPHLRGDQASSPHDSLFWRFGPQRAVRQANWKLVDWRDFAQKTSSGWQLFDLDSDIGEERDQSATHPELVARLSHAWDEWNAKNVAPLWHGSPNEDPTAPERKK